jgi:hypothetical protein
LEKWEEVIFGREKSEKAQVTGEKKKPKPKRIEIMLQSINS